STLRTGSNPAILFLLGDKLRPVARKDSIQRRKLTGTAILVFRRKHPCRRPRQLSRAFGPFVCSLLPLRIDTHALQTNRIVYLLTCCVDWLQAPRHAAQT